MPITRRVSLWVSPAPSNAAPGPSFESDFSVKSWATSGSSLKSAARVRE